MAVAVWLALLSGLTTFVALSRHAAVSDARDRAGQVVVEAQFVRGELSSADAAAAASVFRHALFDVQASDEAGLRAVYGQMRDEPRIDERIGAAGEGVVRLQQLGVRSCLDADPAAGSACAGEILTELGQLIPRYASLVSAGQANGQTGDSVAEAYLRAASDLVRDQIIPKVDMLLELGGRDVDVDFRRATDGAVETVLLLLFAGGGAGLTALQVHYWRRSRRVFELRLLAATVCLLAAGGLFAAGALAQQARVQHGVDDGYMPMVTLAQARVFALQARAEENLDLMSLGIGTEYDEGLDTAVEALGYDAATGNRLPPGVLPGRSGSLVLALRMLPGDVLDPAVEGHLRTWLTNRNEVVSLLGSTEGTDAISSGANSFERAARLTAGPGADAFGALDDELAGGMEVSTQRFRDRMSTAATSLTFLGLAAGVLLAAAAGLVVWGMRRRLREYR
ncbi:hypothetical protein MXD62_36895 [Frankia sp. Mgl5]|uniref:hypothetical protein n=1 Tax=Frankia sp. Mgl5 TaxID=2933793 RepID=UPI00200F37A1|nr:hypothetical protein [Frankia sp. Mgl5]MCK9932655.1 hypothetical protein [Frankia sp. Mgl5]